LILFCFGLHHQITIQLLRCFHRWPVNDALDFRPGHRSPFKVFLL